jgi:NAD(P)H-hydrate repair Nnr-like enzyme with NAD(P)H-hydrate epimerase domain
MLALMSSMACSRVEIPAFLSRHCEVRTIIVSAYLHKRLTARRTVERWRHKLDLDLVIGGVLGLGGAQSLLDSVDTLIAEASNCAS